MNRLLRILSRLASLPSLSFAQRIGRGLGRLIAWTHPRRGEVLRRIRTALPDVGADGARRLYAGMYRNLGQMVMEVLRLPHVTDEELDCLVTFRNVDRLQRALEQDRGVVIACAHTGNWEMMAALVPRACGVPLSIIVKDLRPRGLDRWVRATRGRWGTQVYSRSGSLRPALACLRRKEALGFILDQNVRVTQGVFVDFFGRPACTTNGLAEISALSQSPIVVLKSHRAADNTLVFEFGEVMEPPRDRSPGEIQRVTQRCTTAIEAMIREHPEQWIWMHRRWRTRPPLPTANP